jgi:hypothetical protein
LPEAIAAVIFRQFLNLPAHMFSPSEISFLFQETFKAFQYSIPIPLFLYSFVAKTSSPTDKRIFFVPIYMPHLLLQPSVA